MTKLPLLSAAVSDRVGFLCLLLDHFQKETGGKPLQVENLSIMKHSLVSTGCFLCFLRFDGKKYEACLEVLGFIIIIKYTISIDDMPGLQKPVFGCFYVLTS